MKRTDRWRAGARNSSGEKGLLYMFVFLEPNIHLSNELEQIEFLDHKSSTIMQNFVVASISYVPSL